MISFLEYLLEEKKQMFFLQTFEVAKAYFEKTNTLSDSGLKLSDIEKIYQYIDSNKGKIPQDKIEPIVADYKGQFGVYAFRRWVKKLFPKLIPNGKFKGFHDTQITVKTNTADTWKPNAQAMESVICLACNNVNDLLTTQQKKVLLAAEQKLTAIKEGELTEDEIADSEKANIYYLKHKDELNAIANTLTDKFKSVQFSPMDKLANSEHVTSEWKENGNYGKFKANNTPKTDIISKDGKVKVSLKQGDKGAQLMSGVQRESAATIISAIKKIHGEKKYKKILNILNDPNFKFAKFSLKMTDDELVAAKKPAIENVKELNNLLEAACSEDRELKYAIMYEAATGETKFGENAVSTANAVLVWSIANPALNYADNIDEYINKILDKAKIFIAFKTTESSTFQVLRITTPKGKIH